MGTKRIKGGNNLVLDTIHDNSEQLPIRMAPMVLLGTVLTHLFGGSAGREGTAVQMGASLADAIAHRLNLHHDGRRQLPAAGLAGGLGTASGTPLAGKISGLEVVWVGRIDYHAILPALVASGWSATSSPARAALRTRRILSSRSSNCPRSSPLSGSGSRWLLPQPARASWS